jgi:hypothetical protein
MRLRACKHLGMETVPASWVVTATGMTEDIAAQRVLPVNINPDPVY